MELEKPVTAPEVTECARVKTQIDGAAKPHPVQSPITEHKPKLVELLGHLCGARCRQFFRDMQKCVPCACRELAKVVIKQDRTGVHPPLSEIVVEVPFQVAAGSGRLATWR